MRFFTFSSAVALGAIAMFGCGGSSSGGGGTSTGATVSVSMPAGSMFTPMDAPANAGDTIEWTNNDSLPHTIKPDAATAGMDSDPAFPSGLSNGQKFSWTVPSNATPGTKYYYHCKFHGTAGNGSAVGNGMAGVITVQ